MNNYIIYEDDVIKVEIDRLFHEALSVYNLPYIILPTLFQKILLGDIAEVIVQRGVGKGDDIIVCSNKVYKIFYNKMILLDKEFNFFQSLVDGLTKIKDLNTKRKVIEEEINKKMDSKNFYCEFFEKDIFGVTGYFCYNTGKKILILFFTSQKKEI